MAEILEYCLVIMVSTLFVAGSVATYDAFSGSASALEFSLATSSISKLAADAIANGSATGAVAVPASTLRCEDGALSLTSGTLAGGVQLPAACDFTLAVQGGVRSFSFHYGGRMLTASVA